MNETVPKDGKRSDGADYNESGYHQLPNGIRVTQDPERYLVDNMVGQGEYGIPTPTEYPEKLVPRTSTSFIPTERAGSVPIDDDVKQKLGNHNAVLLEGESGTGKNTLINIIAENRRLPVYRYNFGLDSSIYEIIAQKDVVNQETIVTLGKLAMPVIFGGFFVGDEINMVEGDITSHLHDITEEKGKRRFELLGTGRTLTDLPEGEEWDPEKHLGEFIHPAFRFVATANPVKYSGAGEMNYAFRSRFSVVPIDYPPNDAEAALLAEKTGVDKNTAEILVSGIGDELRSMYSDQQAAQSGTLNCPIPHRQLEKVLEYMTNHNTTLEEAVEAEILPFAQLPMDRDAIRSAIDDRFP